MKFDITNKIFVVLFFLLMTSVLVTACGSEESAEDPPSEVIADTFISEETIAINTAVPEPTSTDAPLIATPLPEPTSTAVLSTTIPTLTPEVNVTATVAVDTAVLSAQTACDHPYLPIREGATWAYDGPSGSLTWTVTSVEGNMEVATAQMQVNVADVVLNYVWDCTTEGMASFDLATMNMPSGFGFTLEPVSLSGQFLLPAEQLQTDMAWQLIANVTAAGEIEGEAVSGEMTHTQDIAVLNSDPVTFDGTTVEGLQMARNSTIQMTMSASGMTFSPPPMVMDSTHTMGLGIGITEMVTSSPYGVDTLSLVSYSIP